MGTNETAATDRMLEKVRALIAKAEGTDSAPEREALIERAQALMLKYSIDQAVLDATRPADQRIKPDKLEFFTVATGDTPIRDALVDLASATADYFGCKIVYFGLRSKRGAVYATAVGYPSDLRSFQTLFTALHLDLASQISPKPVANKSFDENVWVLRNAGTKWSDIAKAMNALRDSTPENSGLRAAWKPIPIRSDNQYPIPAAAYRRYCKQIGEAPRRTRTPVGYQRNFATAYVAKVHLRLVEQKMKAEDGAGVGTALVLRSDNIDEAFSEMFPKVKEAPKSSRSSSTYDATARRAGRAAGERADIGLNRTGSGSSRPELDG